MSSSSTIQTPEGLIRPEVELIGQDGNAFSILGATTRALREAGNDEAVLDAYREQAQSGDYGTASRWTMEFADVC